jgi:UDP-N-acetyl-D-glucosamine dehydrogenase
VPSSLEAQLAGRLAARSARVGVIGLGYVGLPLLSMVLARGYPALGFDIDPAKLESLRAGRRYIRHLPVEGIAEAITEGRAAVTDAYEALAACEVVVICVPTPLGAHREPDLSYIEATARGLAPHLHPGCLVILESTTYPGTTTGVLRPILEAGGRRSGEDFFLAYSPEREDPGNPRFSGATIPRIVSGDGGAALRLARGFYGSLVAETIAVSSPDTAEAVKLTENIFRAVNIALVNELKIVYGALGIDIWEVIEAAKSKPFGYMPFYPGPGLGGHCIPIDPFYLTWKAREVDITTRFIELAGEINTSMPRHVVDRTAEALSRSGKAMAGAGILLVGLAYKPEVDDTRESPAFRLWDLLEARGAKVAYHDPYVATVPMTRRHGHLAGRPSRPLEPGYLASLDAAIICTAHRDVDYASLVAHCPLLIDTRNATARWQPRDNIVKA